MLKFQRITIKDFNILKSFVLRAEDVDELLAVSGLETPEAALRQCLIHSHEWAEVTLNENYEVIMLHGLSSYDNVGIPWMVASVNIYHHQKFLLRYSRKVIKQMFDNFDVLANCVDSRNVKHIHWLKYMGFKFKPALDTTINGVLFLYFYKYKEDN